MRKILKVALATTAVAAVLIVAAWGWMRLAPRRVPAGQPPLLELNAQSLSTLRAAFNAARGDVRLVVLLSPT